jgi:hypothetical protein
MHHAFGLTNPSQEDPWPLIPERRWRFDTSNFPAMGYFDLISPIFEDYAERDSGQSINSINVLILLRDSDLPVILQRLNVLEHKVSARQTAWREFLGTCHPSHGAPNIRIEPLIFRARALSLIGKLRTFVQFAISNNLFVAYGNGVLYRHLLGRKLPAGTVEYS